MQSNSPILLVEDDQVDTMTVVRAFEINKVKNPLQIVLNGEEALNYLRKEGKYSQITPAPKPGIILLDLNMPVMNGIEFLNIVKNDDRLKTIPVIVLTSSNAENDRVESYRLSVAGYIVKPVDFCNFVDVVRIIALYWTLNETV